MQVISAPKVHANHFVRLDRLRRLMFELNVDVIGLSLDCGFAGYRWLNGLIRIVASIHKRLKHCLNFDRLFRCRFKLANYCHDLCHSLEKLTNYLSNYITETIDIPEYSLRFQPPVTFLPMSEA